MITGKLIIVRGAGDLATGIIHRLHKSGFYVLVLEADRPSAIRRHVAFCEAVYEETMTVEGVTAVRIQDLCEMQEVFSNGQIPILMDPRGESIQRLAPDVVIDAIIAKRNLGTQRDMASLTIAIGPGFVAGTDVDVVIETMRGHDLGRILYEGSAAPDTGIPGVIQGYGKERVIHAGKEGQIRTKSQIGDYVEKDQILACIEGEDGHSQVTAELSGILRGIIRDGFFVTKGFKIADIDPRKEEKGNCDTISDKSRCIAGSVLEVVCGHFFTME
ncbi:MAG: selenium-dependent molybdenum cofactor biosynthesis protein YqeB [Lachnospiraceae bacterium]